MNKVELMGRLTKDVEIKKSKTGKDMAVFTLAVTRRSNKEMTDFINCVAFGKLPEILTKYTKKGIRIIVEGELNINTYTDKEGKNQNSVNILVNDFYFVDSIKKEETTLEDLPF